MAATNEVRLIASSDSCGDSAADAPFASITGFSATQVTASGSYRVYGLGTATAETPFGGYTLCWSHSPGGDVTKFSFAVGMFILHGPDDQTTACTLTASCAAAILMPT